MQISQLMQDKPRTPLETTGDWIEYVIRHGGARHLRAQVFNIPWYQYYLLDVIAFLVAIVTLVVMMIRLTCRQICRLCCEKSRNKAKKEYSIHKLYSCREEWELIGNSSSARAQLHHYYYWGACGNQLLSTVYFEKRQNGSLITKKALLVPSPAMGTIVSLLRVWGLSFQI